MPMRKARERPSGNPGLLAAAPIAGLPEDSRMSPEATERGQGRTNASVVKWSLQRSCCSFLPTPSVRDGSAEPLGRMQP